MSSYTFRAPRRSPALHKLMMSSEPEALLASPPCSRRLLLQTQILHPTGDQPGLMVLASLLKT